MNSYVVIANNPRLCSIDRRAVDGKVKFIVWYRYKGTRREVNQAHLPEPIPRAREWHSMCFNMPQHTSQAAPRGGMLAGCAVLQYTLLS